MDDEKILWRLKASGHNYRDIAELTGLTLDEIRERMRLPRAGDDDPANADPNELLIQLTASAIRLSWSPAERRSRHLRPDNRVSYDSPVSIATLRN